MHHLEHEINFYRLDNLENLRRRNVVPGAGPKQKYIEDAKQKERDVPDLVRSIIRPTDLVKEELRLSLSKSRVPAPGKRRTVARLELYAIFG